MLKQQIIGVINLALPIVLLFQIYPTLFFVWYGKMICALIMGLYIWYLNKQNLNTMIANLKFSPTGKYKKALEAQINTCGLQTENISLIYAYTNESLAITAKNTIIIDPIVWSSINEDPEAIKVINIFNTITYPILSELQKSRLHQMQEALSHDAQSFIFKHELGHVARHYSHKKLVHVFIIGTISTYIGITAAIHLLPFNGWLAIFIGMLAGGSADLFFAYLSNGTFKKYEEEQADIFAIRFSSNKEIDAAAMFFEKHQEILNTYSDHSLIKKLIPSIFLSGYLDGKTRAVLLRSYLKK